MVTAGVSAGVAAGAGDGASGAGVAGSVTMGQSFLLKFTTLVYHKPMDIRKELNSVYESAKVEGDYKSQLACLKLMHQLDSKATASEDSDEVGDALSDLIARKV